MVKQIGGGNEVKFNQTSRLMYSKFKQTKFGSYENHRTYENHMKINRCSYICLFSYGLVYEFWILTLGYFTL